MGALLIADRLTKNFGALRVADQLCLSLHTGARHAVIGPNGAGKTGLVGLLSGTLRLDAGSILLDQRDITRLPPDARVRAGLVRSFQVTNLFPNLRVRENMFLAIAAASGQCGSIGRAAGRRADLLVATDAALDRLKLLPLAHRRLGEIAYGQQRLVELALTLALHPRMLLLDEPAAGIPGNETHLLLDAIEALPADLAFLLIDHDMQLVRRFARAITVMARGRVLAEGAPDDILSDPLVRAAYLGAGP